LLNFQLARLFSMGVTTTAYRNQSDELRFLPAKRANAYLLVGDATAVPIRIDDRNLPGGHLRENQPFLLRILHLNDLHGQVTRLTAHGEAPVISRLATHIKSVRESLAGEENAAVLILSAGDDIGGSPLDLLVNSPAKEAVVHPIHILLDELGLSAAAVGNHDLDFGEATLVNAAREIDFPFLSANLAGSSVLGDVIFPAMVYCLKGIRIGIIGLTTPSRMKHLNAGTWSVTDPVQAVANLLPLLQPLCDVIILLSHLGYQRENYGPDSSLGDIELARMLPAGSVQLIIGGHSHDALNEDCIQPVNVVNGIPIVQAGAYGRYLGDVTLTIRSRNGRSRASLTDAHLIHTADLPVDEAFETSQVRPLLDQVHPLLNRVIGRVDPDPSLWTPHVRQHFDAGELALANFVTDAIHDRCHENGFRVDVTMIDASVMRAGLPEREALTLEDWFRVMPFADSIVGYELTGQQLLDLLCDNVYRFGRWDEAVVERGFAHFSRQVRYQSIHGWTRRETILLNPLIRGVPLAARLKHRFLLATHSHFRASAAAWENIHWPAGISRVDRRHWPAIETGLSLREECLHTILQYGGITRSAGAKLDGRLRVAEPETEDEYRHVFHQPPFPRPGDGGRTETPAEHRYSLG
jgi:5'-nucleotidase/5'-nucleotidase/UDP-sugar diphosphatase